MSTTIWVARNNDKTHWDGWDRNYAVSLNKKKPRMGKEGFLEYPHFKFCPREFHRAFPNIRLKPGEGPIRVTLTATVEEE